MSTGRKIVLAVVIMAVVIYGMRAQARSKRRVEGARIMDRFVEVTGGAKAYQAIQTMIVHGKGQLMGNPVVIEEYRAAPGKLYSVVMGKKTAEHSMGTDGTTAWRISNRAPMILIGSERLDCLRSAAIDGVVRWREFFKSAECVGTAEFAGHKCYKVVLAMPIGSDKTCYYDMETNYLLGEEYAIVAPYGTTPPILRRTLENYQPFGGILLPTRETEKVSNNEGAITVEDVAINPEIAEETFALPGSVKVLQVGLPGYLK